MTIPYGAQGLGATLRGHATNLISLAAGNCYNVPPGAWNIALHKYHTLQFLDPVMGIWVAIGSDMGAGGGPGASAHRFINSDGYN